MIIKKIALFSSILATSLLLSSCGSTSSSVSTKNTDGTTTKIKYTKAAAFERAPYFTGSSKSVTMSFNGIDWYIASIISASEKAAFDDKELLAETSNLKEYSSDSGKNFDFSIILDLDGTDDSYILFETDSRINSNSMGNDFTTSISYFVDSTQTVPDLSNPKEYVSNEDLSGKETTEEASNTEAEANDATDAASNAETEANEQSE
ncbi:MAG: hypothetical protein K6F97_00150 [Lachnospiraceae bacterium]|nr:hypothetical protein [Lachnospiraceae bacterium]